MVIAEPRAITADEQLTEARAALAREWREFEPLTGEDIAEFYRSSTRMGADLDAWHATADRQKWTEVVQYVAGSTGAQTAVDIGCGAGYELRALKAAGLSVSGVEPNELLRERVRSDGIDCIADVADAPIESADLLVCLDVLEHLPTPWEFLAGVTQRAHLGAVLVETTATHDVGTPLHLATNRGWHPGNVLEQGGWELIDARDRIRVWQRMRLQAEPRTSVLLCAYRNCSIPTMSSMLKLQNEGWRVTVKHGDGLISRARSIVTTRWWAETADDVMLMIDDDVVFEPESAKHLVELCRNGHDIVCAAYPVRDGGHLAIRGLGGGLVFGPDQQPVEIRYAATGFVAIHRRVLDALIPSMPWCHANQPWAFKPLFLPLVLEDHEFVGHNYLSEDWAFCERAHQAGFKIWLDPTIKLGHLAQIEMDVNNMHRVHDALKGESDA